MGTVDIKWMEKRIRTIRRALKTCPQGQREMWEIQLAMAMDQLEGMKKIAERGHEDTPR